jgi:hypothetical protein
VINRQTIYDSEISLGFATNSIFSTYNLDFSFSSCMHETESLSILVTCGLALSAIGLIPRFSPGRAIWLALRSRFAFKPNPESVRVDEIKRLRRMITDKDFGQSYVVVIGEKGVGKTCLLNTVTSKTPGVIKVRAMPSDKEDNIIHNTLDALVDPPLNMWDPITTAPRVIFWYRLFTFGRSPIVIIKTTEPNKGKKCANITGGVRSLVDDYKLRVVVVGTPNCIDECLLPTMRQRVVDIKPMTKEMIWQMSQLQPLFKYVKEAGLDDIVFAVLGGVPACYMKLWFNTEIELEAGGDARQVIGAQLSAAIFDAIKLVLHSSIDMRDIIKLYDKENKCLISDTFTLKNLKRSNDDIFLQVERGGRSVLIPASNAIGIVLEHNLVKKPSLDELEKLVNKPI